MSLQGLCVLSTIRYSVVLVVLVLLGAVLASEKKGPRPPVANAGSRGSFVGSLLTSRRDRTIYSFRGIRYAEPPVGQLRFRPPRPIERYGRRVDASEDGPACPQPGFGFYNMSEDCLRLNVYSPVAPNHRGVLLPVLVFFHAGGFYSVSGQSTLEGPQYLEDHDMVLVTANYRLASLGLLSTGDEHAPGNNAFKDQVAVLRWVQRFVRHFGGDPGRVTIGGYSAGGISVALHMLSPMSKGLFHGVISMSGAPTAQWDVPPHQRHLADKQAQHLDCPTDTSRRLVECLRTKTWQELGDSLGVFAEFGWDPVLRWRPVVEPDVGLPRFLTARPDQLIKEGRVYDVPLMLGISELEFVISAYNVLSNDTMRETMDREWDRLAPISFLVDPEPPRSTEIVRELRRAYIGDLPFTYNNDTALALGRLYGDALISFGTHRLSRLMSEQLSSPVYYYKFNYTGSTGHAYYPGTTTVIGAAHHDELIYLFHGSALFPYIGLDSPHSNTVDRLTTMWSNFVTRSDPNPVGEQPVLAGLRWPQLKPDTRQYLQINQQEFVVLDHMYEERFAVWERLFSLS